MAKYNIFNVAANKDNNEIAFAFMVELNDMRDAADLEGLKKCISAVFSSNSDTEFRFSIIEDTNPLSKKMLLEADERFLSCSLVDFRKELSAMGIILKSASKDFEAAKLVNISFEYVVRKGSGYNIQIIANTKAPIGNFTAKFIQVFPLSAENVLGEH